ncbi:hypothetical protein GQ37_022360 [Janthinobacterium sp. BJB1]|nr:hypothetical protein GQ37_022360 [Janthinobacterium sp. BJB1]
MLQGQTYDQIAARFRVTNSTVSKSVSDLARDLQTVVGVVRLDEDSTPTAHLIRAHGKDYLKALEHFVPLAKQAATTILPIITQAHIDQLVLHTARHSRCKQRDIALLLILIHTGVRPNEIARLTVADYIDAAGLHRSPPWLPAGAASNGIAPPPPASASRRNSPVLARRLFGVAPALDAHSPALMALARQIRRLADHCPVLMLQGTFSHEPPGTLDLFSPLGGRYPIHVANRRQRVILNSRREWTASTHSRFDANDWRDTDCALLCSCVPTMNKENLAASVGAEQPGQAMGHYLADLLAGYAPGNLLARQRRIPAIALSHGTVIGCMTEHGVPMAGMDHEFTAGALFQAQANAFMLGHIHLHQACDHNGQVPTPAPLDACITANSIPQS